MWPLWSKVYAAFVAVPMIFVSIGIAFWIVRTNLGGALDNMTGISVTITIGVFALAFLFTGWLFGLAVQRVVTDQAEALVFAATAHLMMAIPAIVFTIIAFVQSETLYLADLQRLINDAELNRESSLLFWMVSHTYIGLFLAMADNTSPLEQRQT